MSARKQKKREIQAKNSYLLKDPRYNIRSLVTAAEDVLYVHGGHNGGKAANQFRLLRLPGMVRELGHHLIKVLAGAEL